MEALMQNKWRKSRENWEQTRIVGYITAQSQSTKKLDPRTIIPLPWDNEGIQDYDEPSKEEREAIMKEMKEMEKMLNKENNNQIDGK